jgi:hypothetical protein
VTGPERRELALKIDQAVREKLRNKLAPTAGHCKGCGLRFEETPERMSDTGCWHCRDRIRRKEQRLRESQDPAIRRKRLDAHNAARTRRRKQGLLVRGCSGCQQPYDQLTHGCRQCKERHARNSRHRSYREVTA